MNLQEYETLSKTQALKHYNESQWNELRLYAYFLSRWAKYYGIEDIPEVKGDNINFKSFIGSYFPNNSKRPLQIKLNRNKLSDIEYHKILSEVIDWCNLLGPNVISQLDFLPPDNRNDRILSYSNQLVELTELTRDSYLTPLIKQELKISPIVYGQIDVPKTIKYLAQTQTLVVSKKNKIELDILPVLLLIRFNLQMFIDLEYLLNNIMNKIDDYKKNDETISIERVSNQNLLYHQDILLNSRNHSLTPRAIETDFFNPDVIEETYRQTNGNPLYVDLIILWEGYISNKNLQPVNIEHLFGGFTLKPMSKIYELWLLKQFDIALRCVFGEPLYSIIPKSSMTLTYQKQDTKIILNYNLSLPRTFKRFKPFPYSLRPDFVLSRKNKSANNKIILIADAKYKESVKSADIQQMLAYMLTTGWTESSDNIQGLILYPGAGPTGSDVKTMLRKTPDASIVTMRIRPALSNDEFRSLLNSVVRLSD